MGIFSKKNKDDQEVNGALLKDQIRDIKDNRGLFYSRIKISDNIEKEKDTGYLFCKNSVLGHVGVQKYDKVEVGINDKGTIEVVREESDVFNEDSLKSFGGKPLTVYHPEVMVDSKNVKEYSVGHIQNVRRDGDNVIGDIVIQDSEAVQLVENGKLKDLSLGYQAKLSPMADGRLKQENIVINHLALVEEGRAINARIVDHNSVVVGNKEQEKEKDYKEIKDTIHRRENTINSHTISEYDDETGQEKTTSTRSETNTATSYEKLKEEYYDDKKMDKNNNPKGDNDRMEKNFKYYLGELKDIRSEPKSEFRDTMYKALNEECKENLGVELPPLEKPEEQSATANSVGLHDSTANQDDDKDEKGKLILDSRSEEEYFQNLYRKMDDPSYAKELARKTYHDVYDVLRGKGEL